MKLKTLNAIVLISSILALSLSLQSSFGQSATQPYFMAGIQQPFTHIGYREGAYYYAKNSYGLVEYSGGDAKTVLQSALDSVVGANIMLTRGIFDIASTLKLGTEDTLQGAGCGYSTSDYTTTLKSTITDGSPVISTYGNSTSNPQYGVTLKNLRIEGNGLEGDGIFWEYNVRNCLIDHVFIQGVGGNGIYFYHSFGTKIFDSYVLQCSGDGIRTEYRTHSLHLHGVTSRANVGLGLNVSGTTADDSSTQLSIFGGNYQENQAGDIYVSRCKSVVIEGVFFENAYDLYSVVLTSSSGTGYTYDVTMSACYFGLTGSAKGMRLNRTYNVIISSTYFNGANELVRIDTPSKYTTFINSDFSHALLTDNGEYTSYLNWGYVRIPNRTHPSTSGWGQDRAGRMWFCTDHDVIEYWNGTDIITP